MTAHIFSRFFFCKQEFVFAIILLGIQPKDPILIEYFFSLQLDQAGSPSPLPRLGQNRLDPPEPIGSHCFKTSEVETGACDCCGQSFTVTDCCGQSYTVTDWPAASPHSSLNIKLV